MTQIIRLQDLSAAEVSRLLAANGDRLADDQRGGRSEVRHGEIVRIKRACDALKGLATLRRGCLMGQMEQTTGESSGHA